MRGGYGSSDHGTLADRVARGRGETPGQVPVEVDPGPVSPARHCRVAGEPSLLVEWARSDRGWEGRVISVLWVEPVGWATVARWLPASQIEPVP